MSTRAKHFDEQISYEVPLISTRYLRKFIHFMQARGVSQDALLANTGVEAQMLNNPDLCLPVNTVLKVLEKAAWLAEDERVPFQFGVSLDLSAHGLLGYVLLSKQTNFQLVELVAQHLGVCVPLMHLECSSSGTQAKIRLVDNWDVGTARTFLLKVHMGSIYSIVSHVARDFHFEFDFSSSLEAASWRAVAPDSQWSFDGSCNEITLSLKGRNKSDHASRIQSTLARELGIAMETADAQSTSTPSSEDIAQRVRGHVLRRPERAGLEQTAGQLGMSARYLRQHLAKAGTSFRTIRQEVRRRYADRYLRETQLSLTDIARKLGFSDQASFTKAYRSWTGSTPGDARTSASQQD